MKKLIFGLGIITAGLTCSIATAQDYYSYQPGCCPDQYDPCCCDSDFDGFYIGGNLGVLTDVSRRIDCDGFTQSGSRSFTNTDFTIGVQVGYNWECGCSLLGLVVDWNWVDVDDHHHCGDNGINGNGRLRHELDWFLTIRGRAGVTVCDCLVYLTAGAAVMEFDGRWRNSSSSHHNCDTQWGWAGGFGVEYLVGCNWSVGAEILFMHFDNDRSSCTIDSQTFRFGYSDSLWVGRIIFNYQLGDLFSCFCCR